MTSKLVRKINNKLYYGWVIVAISAISMFFSAPGQTFSISAFIDAYIEEFDFSRTTISAIYSGATLLSGSLLIVMGKLVDRFGQRVMLVTVGLLLSITSFYNSFVATIPMMAIGFFFSRYFGQGSLVLIPSTLVPQWFKKRRGLSFSIFKFGGTIASVIVPVFNIYLITNYGWQSTWRVWSLLLLVVFVPIAWFFVINTPEKIGLRPDNIVLNEEEHHAEAKEVERESWRLSEAVRTKSFWILGLVSCITPLITTGLVFHFYSIVGMRGIDEQGAAIVLGVMGIPGFFFPIIAGGIIDKVGARKILALTLIFEAIGLMVILLSGNQLLLIGAILIYGAGMSTQFVASGVMWPNFFGRKYLGSIQGAATVFGVFGSAFGTLPFGFGYDKTGSYTIVLIGMSVLALMGAVAALSTHSPIKKDI